MDPDDFLPLSGLKEDVVTGVGLPTSRGTSRVDIESTPPFCTSTDYAFNHDPGRFIALDSGPDSANGVRPRPRF
ncbi:hypothetical protein EVAR_10044_1 [Eumeta japonica]|uniref:Uncharacterized protein n=1 Tax=Eumeta variegata TaxID=151549 RepID=A0A4C1TR56_EUMVA|nr:hypothetical protein EVAR_10044_1 [Eumeta japonica]